MFLNFCHVLGCPGAWGQWCWGPARIPPFFSGDVLGELVAGINPPPVPPGGLTRPLNGAGEISAGDICNPAVLSATTHILSQVCFPGDTPPTVWGIFPVLQSQGSAFCHNGLRTQLLSAETGLLGITPFIQLSSGLSSRLCSGAPEIFRL